MKVFEDQEYEKALAHQRNIELLNRSTNKSMFDSIELRGKWTFEVPEEDKSTVIGAGLERYSLRLKPENSGVLGMTVNFDSFGARLAFCEKIHSREFVKQVYPDKAMCPMQMEEHMNKNRIPNPKKFMDKKPTFWERWTELKDSVAGTMADFQKKRREILIANGAAEEIG